MVGDDRAVGWSLSMGDDLIREANALIEISRQSVAAARAARKRNALLRAVLLRNWRFEETRESGPSA